jgi:hypothetical protein
MKPTPENFGDSNFMGAKFPAMGLGDTKPSGAIFVAVKPTGVKLFVAETGNAKPTGV